MLEKERELQRNLGSKEEKLQKLKEHQLDKEGSLSEKEKQLQEMRERTRRMLEKSRQKEQDFEASTQSFNETIKANDTLLEPKKATMKEMLKSKVSDKAKGMSDMARAMKEEMRRKREEAKKDEEDDLLSFLRNSHKKKVSLQNRWCFLYSLLKKKQFLLVVFSVKEMVLGGSHKHLEQSDISNAASNSRQTSINLWMLALLCRHDRMLKMVSSTRSWEMARPTEYMFLKICLIFNHKFPSNQIHLY